MKEIDEFKAVVKAGAELIRTVEHRARLYIRPSPRWIPEALWLWMAARFLRTDRDTKVSDPGIVDLEAVYAAQRSIEEAKAFLCSLPDLFCDQCGAVNPKHGFYPLYHSHTGWKGEVVRSPRMVTCNCCSTTEKYPCLYCEEEKRTGKLIDVRKEAK